MRIKKVSKTTGISAEVVDGYDESSSNAYSCNYINDKTTYSTTEKVIGKWINRKAII